MKRFLQSLLLALCSALLALGDTITLKDGTVLEGKILKESPTSYTMSVKISAGINDEQVIAKSKVKEVQRDGPDDVAFEAIKDLTPAPDRLTADQYRERIGQGQAFLNVYDDSKHAPAVKAMMAKLEAERKLAAAGGLKLEGRWISASDRATNAYEIDARIQLADMKTDFEAGKANPEGRGFMLAMRHFERFEKEFAASELFPDARDLALDVLSHYQPIVENDYARVDARLKKRAEAMKSLSPADRRAEESTIADRDARYKRRIEAEKKAKTKWLTLSRYHKEPLRQVISNVAATVRRLERPISEDAKLAGPIYREAWAAALAGNPADAKKKMGELKNLKVPERYLVPLQRQIDVSEAEPEEEKPKTVVPSETEEKPVEEEKADKDKPKKKDETKSTTGTQPRSDDADGEKGGLSMQLILVIVLVLVIVGALVAAFGGKKKT